MNKGEFTVNLDTEKGIVHIVAHGEFTKEVGEEIITKARTTADKHQYQILCDVRDAEFKVSLADWFFMPRTLSVLRNTKTRHIKAAVLISPGKSESIYQFYETVTQNLGLNFRVFMEEEKALEWLKGS